MTIYGSNSTLFARCGNLRAAERRHYPPLEPAQSLQRLYEPGGAWACCKSGDWRRDTASTPGRVPPSCAESAPGADGRFDARTSPSVGQGEAGISTLSRHSLRVTTSAGRDRWGRPALRLGQGPERGVAPAEAIAAELRTASVPDLAMLVVAGCQLRRALGW